MLGGNNGPPDTCSSLTKLPISELGDRLLRDEPTRHTRGLAKRRPIAIHGGSCASQAARHATGLIALLTQAMPIRILGQALTSVLVWRGARTSRAGITGRPAARGAPALD